MSAKYWIKLYHEVLHDPKMGMLPDNLWRRTIELFLLAGELSIDSPEDERGHLPTTDEIAWLLRQSAADLQKELEQLSRVNIVTQTEAGWLVTKFAERQKAVKADERMRQYRERKRKEKPISDEPETKEPERDKDIVTRSVTKRNIESDIDIESELTPKGVGETPTVPKVKNKSSPIQKEAQAMFGALASLCKYDLEIISDDDRGKLNQAGKIMRDKGYKPNDLIAFESWWYADDWRGQKGQAPTLADVRENWGRFKSDKNGVHQNGKHQSESAQSGTYPPAPTNQSQQANRLDKTAAGLGAALASKSRASRDPT